MKIKKNKKGEEYEIKFWKDWLNADCLERIKLVEKLPIVKELGKTRNLDLPKKQQEHFFALMLNSFFEDLESACFVRYSKNK